MMASAVWIEVNEKGEKKKKTQNAGALACQWMRRTQKSVVGLKPTYVDDKL